MNTMLARAIIGVSLVFLLAAVNGCERREDKERIDALIRNYNAALTTAYETMNFERLREVTTDKEYNKVTVYIKSYAAQGDRLHARLLDLVVRSIGIRGIKAQALTSEQWEYERIDLETGQAVTQRMIYHYEMKYSIIKHTGAWKVDSLNIEQEEKR